jgi:hypothetical protein
MGYKDTSVKEGRNLLSELLLLGCYEFEGSKQWILGV